MRPESVVRRNHLLDLVGSVRMKERGRSGARARVPRTGGLHTVTAHVGPLLRPAVMSVGSDRRLYSPHVCYTW